MFVLFFPHFPAFLPTYPFLYSYVCLFSPSHFYRPLFCVPLLLSFTSCCCHISMLPRGSNWVRPPSYRHSSNLQAQSITSLVSRLSVLMMIPHIHCQSRINKTRRIMYPRGTPRDLPGVTCE
jgi:hypothetical protein